MWYEFGNFRLDTSRRMLLTQQDKAALPLTAKALDALIYLIEKRDGIVEKAALMSAVWPNVVVEENNLNQIISALRKTFGESPGENRFIVTHPGRGYRFVAEVKVVDANAATASLSNQTRSQATPASRSSERKTTGALVAAVVVLFVVIVLGAIQWRSSNAMREQRSVAMAEIANLVSKDQYGAAFARAKPLMEDERMKTKELQELWQQIVLPMKPLVSEAGAVIYFKAYSDIDGEWIKAGVSPLDKDVDAPRGPLRIKIEKIGFRTGYFVIWNPGPSLAGTPSGALFEKLPFPKIPLPMVAEGALSDNMILVPSTSTPGVLGGWQLSSQDKVYESPAFAIARSEVTNQEFKEFIDAGGYDNETYWQGLQFKENGRVLSSAEARKRFVDATNRPGPAGWQLSAYLDGQAELPVGGISWYEAVAYARFRGQSLPTIHHWLRAAVAHFFGQFDTGPPIATMSRFSAEGPVPARSEVGLGPWGTVNMFGNVREWIWNSAGDKALALGGAWSDYASLYQNAYTTEPMRRLPQFGLRLMHTLNEAPIDSELLKPIQLAYDNLDNPDLLREPVSDEAFKAMSFQFTATHAKPTAQSNAVIKETPLWVAEEIKLKFANAEPLTMYIVRPKKHRTALQPILFAPPGDCCLITRPNREILEQLNLVGFVPNSGRALIMPIWSGSYELKGPPPENASERADLQRHAVLSRYQQLVATLDYLETRDDIDSGRVGYYGISNGANGASSVLTTDGRIKAAVLVAGGIVLANPPHPMMDLLNFAPRVRMPVLMINGRYDHAFPYQQSQVRLFNLLGTPADQKAHIVYETGHVEFPANTLARDTTNWFDKYLGPTH